MTRIVYKKKEAEPLPIFKWRVTHPKHGRVEVSGERKYEAIIAAAKVWGVPWSGIARSCVFDRLEKMEV